MTNMLFIIVGIVLLIAALVLGIEAFGWIGIMTTLGWFATGYIMVYWLLKAVLG